jgi:hypothetical protein
MRFDPSGQAAMTRRAMSSEEHHHHHYAERPVSSGEPINVGSFTLVVVGFIALVAVRILAVADWNYPLARSIFSGVSFQDLPALVVGVLFTDVHDTTLLLVAISAYFLFGALGQAGMQRWAVALAATFAAFGLRNVVVSSTNYENAVGSIVALCAIGVVVISSIMRFSDSGGLLVPFGQLAAVVAAMIGVVGIATSSAPWQVRESVKTTTEVIPGWVIASDTKWLRILTDTHPRRIRLVRVEDIGARTIAQ